VGGAAAHEEADVARQRRAAAARRNRSFKGYIAHLCRKNPVAVFRLLAAILDVENKEENRRLRQEARLARAGHRRGPR
jgi:hypothetical protein